MKITKTLSFKIKRDIKISSTIKFNKNKLVKGNFTVNISYPAGQKRFLTNLFNFSIV